MVRARTNHLEALVGCGLIYFNFLSVLRRFVIRVAIFSLLINLFFHWVVDETTYNFTNEMLPSYFVAKSVADKTESR
jgi:hypothetical protein